MNHYFRIAERSDFRSPDDAAQRPAAEDRRSPGRVCVTHYGEAGEQKIFNLFRNIRNIMKILYCYFQSTKDDLK